MYKIILKAKAEKFVASLDKKSRRRMDNAFKSIQENPYSGHNTKALLGKNKGKYRYRVGSIRIIYTVDKGRLTVYIIECGNRGDIY